MAGLVGTMSNQIVIKGVGDLFHESFRDKPTSLATITPEKVHGCDLHEGDFGKAGSCIAWHYTHDGKRRYAKQIIEAIDEEKKSIVFRMIEGDLMEEYKSFIITYHVDDIGGDNHRVTWTLEYEKLNKDVPYPTDLMDFFIDMTKDMEAHHVAASPRLVVPP